MNVMHRLRLRWARWWLLDIRDLVEQTNGECECCHHADLLYQPSSFGATWLCFDCWARAYAGLDANTTPAPAHTNDEAGPPDAVRGTKQMDNAVEPLGTPEPRPAEVPSGGPASLSLAADVESIAKALDEEANENEMTGLPIAAKWHRFLASRVRRLAEHDERHTRAVSRPTADQPAPSHESVAAALEGDVLTEAEWAHVVRRIVLASDAPLQAADDWQTIERDRRSLGALAEEGRALAAEVEWCCPPHSTAFPQDGPSCPTCGGQRNLGAGHMPSCRLSAFLSRAGRKADGAAS